MEDLNRLRLVVVVAKHLNFRRAATELGMSPAALSERVRVFEDQLGVRLFNRTTRSVALTTAGAILLSDVEPALATISGAVANARTRDDAPVGTIRINGPRPTLEFRLLPIVIEFLRLHPGMRVEIVADDGFIDIVASGFDAGMRYGESLDRDMIAVPIGGPQRFMVVGSPTYFVQRGRPTHPSQLSDHNCFAQTFPRGNRLAWTFEKQGLEHAIVPVGSVASTEPAIQLRAAEAGLGLAMLFEEHCGAAVAAGRLDGVLDDWCPPFPGPLLYYPERRLMPPGLRAFVAFIKSSSASS